jgi:hypothetical protein
MSDDISECRCSHRIYRPDYEVCSECGEYIVEGSGEEVYEDQRGNKLCWDCYDLYLEDIPREDIFQAIAGALCPAKD